MAPVPDRAAVTDVGAEGTEGVVAPDDDPLDAATTVFTADAAEVPDPATLVPVTVQVYEPAAPGVWVDAVAPATVEPSRCQA